MSETSSQRKDDLFFNSTVSSYVDVAHNARFLRRDWLAEALDEKLREPGRRFVLLTAEPGAGKSVFMAQLAHDHPEWLRYFIRRDQREVLADVSDKSFLLRVGYQLAARRPELFSQEALRLSVVQRIGEVGEQAEVVGAEVKRLTASPFYQKVLEIEQQVRLNRGKVVGLRVEELVVESRLLQVEDLLHLALIDPARALRRADPKQQIVILIDALDEISYHTTAENILAWLTNCPELPNNIRFVLTSRPPDELLNLFRNKQANRLTELAIAENDAHVKQDIEHFMTALVGEPPVARALQVAEGDTAAFAKKATDKAHGNLGYLDALARGIDRALAESQAEEETRQSGHNTLEALLGLKELPTDLEGLYAFFLNQIKGSVARERIELRDPETGETYDKSVWPTIYNRILGVLAVAMEPLELAVIERLGEIRAERVWVDGALDRLLQFLDVVDGNRYRFYHATVAEFLTGDKTQDSADKEIRDLYQDPAKWHRQIVDYCWQYHPLEWALCDPYGVRYFVEHLIRLSRLERIPARASEWTDRVHELLAAESPSGESIWFETKEHAGDLEGYLADVAAGARQSAELSANDPARSVSLQCRYALMTATVSSFAENLPAELLTASLREELWFPAQVIAHAARVPDVWKRARVFVDLCAVLAEPERERAFDLAIQSIRAGRASESLDALLQIDDLPLRDLRLAWRLLEEADRKWNASSAALLAARLPEIEGPALQLLSQETNPHFLRSALENQAAWRRPPLSALYLDAVRELASDKLRSVMLRSVGPELEESAIVPAAKLALSLEDVAYRAAAISALAPRLPDDLLADAFAACKECNELFTRTRAFIALIPRVPEALPAAIDTTTEVLGFGGEAPLISELLAVAPDAVDALAPRVKRMHSPYRRAQSLIALVPYAPEAVDLALDAIAQQETPGTQVEALAALWQALSPDSWNRALDIVAACKEASDVMSALKSAAPHLPDEHAQQAVEIAAGLPRPFDRAHGVRILASYVKTDVLEPLATKTFADLQAATPEEVSPDIRAASLAELAAVLDIARDATLAAILDVEGSYQRRQIIKRIAPDLPKAMLADALRAARYIGDGSEQVLALKALGELDAQSLDRAPAVARRIRGAKERAAALTELLDAFPDLFDEVIAAIRMIRIPYNQSRALVALAPHVPESRWPDWISVVRDMEDSTTRADTIRNAESCIPGSSPDGLVDQPTTPTGPERAAERETQPRSPQDQIRYADAMVERALADSALVPEAFVAIQDIPSSYAMAWTSALERLAPRLTAAEIPGAGERAYALSDGIEGIVSGNRTKALVALAQHLKDAAADALPGALLDTNSGYVLNLRNLAPSLTPELRQRAVTHLLGLEDPVKRAEGLTALLAVEPAVGDAALGATRRIEKRYEKAEALIRLCPYLPAAVPEAIEAAEGNYSQLAKLVDLTDDALTPALDAALEIPFVDNRDERAEALAALSPRLVALPPDRLHDAWRKIIHRGRERSRSEFLKDVAAVVPIAVDLGGAAAVVGIGNAVEAVCRVWP
jgi:hypothetical protein